MGCFEDRLKHEEEFILQYNEQQLGLSQRSTRQVAESLAEFPAEIDLERLDSLKKKMGLSDIHMSPVLQEQFYACFRCEGSQAFDKGKLLMLGFIMSMDDTQHKVQVLFSLPSTASGPLTRASIGPHFQFAFTLAVETIPNTLSQNVASRFPEAKLTQYIKNLQGKRSRAVESLLDRLFANSRELDLTRLLKVLREQQLERCLSAKGIREFIVSAESSWSGL